MPDFGQHHIISIFKAVSIVVIFMVGIVASWTLNVKMFKILGVIMVTRFVIVTGLVMQYLLSDGLKADAKVVFAYLSPELQKGTSVKELQKFVILQEVASLVLNAVGFAIGLWLLVRYTKLLQQLKSKSKKEYQAGSSSRIL